MREKLSKVTFIGRFGGYGSMHVTAIIRHQDHGTSYKIRNYGGKPNQQAFEVSR